jgi:type I restriction enzyme R subunit
LLGLACRFELAGLALGAEEVVHPVEASELVSLDRGAAKEALQCSWPVRHSEPTRSISSTTIINHLTEHGVMSAALLCESPFTDLNPHGPDRLFTSDEVDALVAVLDDVRAAAVAAA